MAKTIEENSADWESHVFGFGYGTGEEHVLTALKNFMSVINPDGRTYDFQKIEAVCGPTITWLLINILCKDDVKS